VSEFITVTQGFATHIVRGASIQRVRQELMDDGTRIGKLTGRAVIYFKADATMYCDNTPLEILKKIEEAQNGRTLPEAQADDVQGSSRADFSSVPVEKLHHG